MANNVIASRYELVEEATTAADVTTWRAHDSWLSQPVFVVLPDPEADLRFQSMVAVLRGGLSRHLLGLYDVGMGARAFAVLGVPPAVLTEQHFPREEEDVLLTGAVLGSALGALHTRGVVHGGVHPGSVAVGDGGEVWLSPWPLAPEPVGWSGPGGFGVDPDHSVAEVDADVRALGAVLLSTLAGPPILSGEQAAALTPELVDRAPKALSIVERAMTDTDGGGYRAVSELEAACAAALRMEGLGRHGDPPEVQRPAAPKQPRSEGRRVAIGVALVCAVALGAVAMSRTPDPTRQSPGKHPPSVCARRPPAPASPGASGCAPAGHGAHPPATGGA